MYTHQVGENVFPIYRITIEPRFPIKICNTGILRNTIDLTAGNCSTWPYPIGIWQLGDVPRGRGTQYHAMFQNVGVTNVVSRRLRSEMRILLILICEIISVLTVIKVSFITLLLRQTQNSGTL